jgi:hypothetical protein
MLNSGCLYVGEARKSAHDENDMKKYVPVGMYSTYGTNPLLYHRSTEWNFKMTAAKSDFFIYLPLRNW